MNKFHCIVCMQFILIATTPTNATEIATLVKFDGNVQVFAYRQFKPIIVEQKQLPYKLNAGDKIRTKSKTIAKVTFLDHSTVLLKSDTELRFTSNYQQTVESGRAIYKIRKLNSLKGLQVATKSAIIGVKGTEFIVNARDTEDAILLNEGSITVDSIKGSFKKAIGIEKNAFDSYMNDEIEEFSDFQETMNKEFYEYVKSVSLSEGKAIRINSNNELDEIQFSDQDISDFELLNSF